MSITNEEFWSLSPQDRIFYLENKDKLDMVVINGKIHFKVYNNQPYVTWHRFQELMKLEYNLNDQEKEILHFFTDFNDWNKYSMPYCDYGFYYHIDISAHSYALDKLGIDKPVKEWLIDWLQAHGFTPEETATVRYTGGFTSYLGKEVTKSDTYQIEMRCKFTHIPPHYIPQKVHNWVKRNKQFKHLIFGKEQA